MELRKLSPQQEKNAPYSSVNIFGTEGNNWGHYFFISYWRQDCHFTLTSKQHAGLPICRAKAVHVPEFLSYFKNRNPRPPSAQSSALVLPHDHGLTPLSPNIHIQILQTDIHKFP